MTKINSFCQSCNSEFTVTHKMDTSHYTLAFCPFCGSDIDVDEEPETDDPKETYDE